MYTTHTILKQYPVKPLSIILRLTLLFILLSATVSMAQTTYTWDGSSSSDWNDSDNWTPLGVPSLGDGVVVNSTSNDPLYDGTDDLGSLIINSGTFDLNGLTLVVTGNVSLNGGTLTNGTLSVSAPSGATYTQGSITTASTCNLVVNSGSILINGGTINGTASITQNGSSTTTGSGGATFNNTTEIGVSGTGVLRINGNNTFNGTVTYSTTNTASMITEFTNSSIYNGVMNINNMSTGTISVCHSGNSNQLNGHVNIKISNGGLVLFGENNGTSGLAGTKLLQPFETGLTSGSLKLNNFIQNGTTAQSLSGTNLAAIYLEKGTVFNGSVTFSFPQIFLNGATYNNTASFTYTSSFSTSCDGGNTFNGNTAIIKSGTGNIIQSDINKDIFNGNATFTNSTSGILYVAHNDTAASTQFNGNVSINNTSTGSIRFGQGTGSVVLASGKTLNVGSSGVSSGTIQLRNFTQSGNTAQSMTFTGTATLRLQNNSVFNGTVTYTAPQLFVGGVTFNAVTFLEKTGASSNTSTGGNTFNDDVTIKNSGSGNMTMTGSTADVFNGNANFIVTGGGDLFPVNNTVNSFRKNISTVGSTKSITFGNGSGVVQLDGSINQLIQADASFPPVFRRLTINSGSGGYVTLQTPIQVSTTLTLTNGIIYTSSTNILNASSQSTTVALGSSASYIDGPMSVTMTNAGTSTLTLPVGKGGDHRPVRVTPTHSNSSSYTYTAELFNEDANDLSCTPIPTGIANISTVHYWKINRTSGSAGLSSATVQLYYGSNDVVTDFNNLRVIKSAGSSCPSAWVNVGGTATGNGTGSITSAAFSSFSDFTLGNLEGGGNPLPVQLADFSVNCVNKEHLIRWTTLSELNCKEFNIEQSVDGNNWNTLGQRKGQGTTSIPVSYEFKPLQRIACYYRLKQIDFDETYEYSPIIRAEACNKELVSIQLHPNPSSGNVQIQYSGINLSEVASVRIQNVLGTTSLIQTTAFEEINIQQEPAGLYIVSVYMNNGEIHHANLIKQ